MPSTSGVACRKTGGGNPATSSPVPPGRRAAGYTPAPAPRGYLLPSAATPATAPTAQGPLRSQRPLDLPYGFERSRLGGGSPSHPDHHIGLRAKPTNEQQPRIPLAMLMQPDRAILEPQKSAHRGPRAPLGATQNDIRTYTIHGCATIVSGTHEGGAGARPGRRAVPRRPLPGH